MGWGGAGPSGTAFGDTALLVRIAVVTGRRVEGLGEPVTGRSGDAVRIGWGRGPGRGPHDPSEAGKSGRSGERSARRSCGDGVVHRVAGPGARSGAPESPAAGEPSRAGPGRAGRGRGSRIGQAARAGALARRGGFAAGGLAHAAGGRRWVAGVRALAGRRVAPQRSPSAGPPRSRFPRPEAVDCVTVLRPPLCCRTRPRAADSLTAINPGPPTGLRVARRQVSGRAPATRAPVGLTPAHPGRSARSGGL